MYAAFLWRFDAYVLYSIMNALRIKYLFGIISRFLDSKKIATEGNMRKKILTGILALSMIACMTACGTKEDASIEQCGTKENTSSMKTEQTTTEATTEATTQAAEATTAASSEETPAAESTDNSVETSDGNETAVEESGDSGYYVVCTNIDKRTVEEFAANVKTTYLQEDWSGLSNMITYPITMYPDVTVNNADEFLSYMENKTVSSDDRTELEKETCVNLFANSTGICLGSGQVWIGEDFYNPGKLGIIGINGVVEK